MNPVGHSKLSVKKRGGLVDDYYQLHAFIDSTKEVCSDNRHRILHTHWGIRRVIIPIFGHTLYLATSKEVNIKDVCEHDHILPDYRNRFIPTLLDFADELEELEETERARINEIHLRFDKDKDMQELLMSPFRITGQLKSLRITYNSWFCNDIIPQVFRRAGPEIEGGVRLFEKMNFAEWMDNGIQYPKPAKKLST